MNEITASRKRSQAPAPSAAPLVNSAASTAEGSARAKARRGFAVMDKSRQREIASAGGRAAHARGNAHEFTPDEAREAGRKGGRSVSNDKDHMASIGRKGGIERGKRHAERQAQEGTHKMGTKSDAFFKPDAAVKSDAFFKPDAAVKSDAFFKPDAAVKSDAFFKPDAAVKSDAFFKPRRRTPTEAAQAAG